MGKILKLIDIFSKHLVLTYKGEEKFKTNFGGILTIISFIIIMINAIFIGKDIVLKENPNVIQITKEEKFTPTHRLGKNNTFIEFGFSNDTNLVDAHSYFEIIPTYYVQTQNNKNESIFKTYLLEIDECEKTKDESNYADKCIKDMDLYITGSWMETSITYLDISIRKCSNETYLPDTTIKTEEEKSILENFIKNLNGYQQSEYLVNKEFHKGLNLLEKLNDIEKNRNKTKTICKPKEEIEKILNQPLYIDIKYSQVNSNPTKQDNSLFPIKRSTYFSIANGLQKSLEFYYTSYVAQMDNGLIFEDYKTKQNIVGVTNVEKDFKLIYKDDDYLVTLTFYMSHKTKIFKKRYIKVQEIFSQLGGFISLTILILKIFSSPFLNKKKYLKIINEFFEINYDEEISNNINNIKLEEKIKDFNSRRRISQGNDIIEQNNIIEQNKIQKDLHLIKILKDRKKKFTDEEIFKTAYYLFCCGNQNLKKKNLEYNLAIQNISTGTDYLEVVKLNREFKILKYLLLNNVQQRLFDFLINLKLGEQKLYDINEYPGIIDAEDAYESLKIIRSYYENELNENGINKIDNKLLQILHPNIKKILEDIDTSYINYLINHIFNKSYIQ